MATERNVVDFKIHNLTEEKFQELKAQGKIDPNAIYCTPDTTLKMNQITNCITEIPQDIQIQTSGETVTLEAGSKVYIPNGNGVFNDIVIPENISNTGGATGAFVVTNGRSLNWSTSAFSGTTAPSAPANGTLWYDTANNLVKRFSTSSGSWVSGFSLPIALFNSQDNSKTKIFNGFGYIGSTVFALPGVKGVVPSGRNEDGTLKNGIVTLNKVSTYNKSGNFDKWGVYISTGGKLYSINNSFVYNEHENLIRHVNDGTPFGVFQCGTATSIDNKISFEPKTTFHAVDYNDFKNTVENTVEELNSSISAVDSSAVHKTGNETVADIKTFAAPSLRISNVAGTGGTGLNILDSNGKGQTYLHHFYTGGRYYSRLVNRNATAAKTSYVEVVVNDDGKSEFTSYNVDNMYAPTPVASSNGTNIATTAWVRDLFETLYPVGSLYITSTNTTTCPLASIVKKSDGSNSTWALVSSGRALWTGTGSNGNTTIAAGLPNITGKFMIGATNNTNDYTGGILATEGAFSSDWSATNHSLGGGSGYSTNRRATFDASRSSSVYGNSTTVQPPAYVVNVWRRTA